MDEHIVSIIDHIHRLESELEVEFAKCRLQLAYSVKGRVVQFEERVLKRHRELRRGLWKYVLGARPMILITAPVIYSLIIPFALLDVFMSIYQHACFPVYGIAIVPRAKYLILDRGQLAYLNLIEKLNCLFCSYVIGLIGYVREIASLTEQYWCPIKHARRVVGAHERYHKFADYGDAEIYHSELRALRADLHTDSHAAPHR